MKRKFTLGKKEKFRLTISRNERYLLLRFSGHEQRPLRMDIINLDGQKVRSSDLLYGQELVINLAALEQGEYLYAVSSASELIQTGVLHL